MPQPNPRNQSRTRYGSPLTDQEVETLRLLALGHTPDQIARRQRREPASIRKRIERAATKLGTSTTVATVCLAYQMGHFALPRIGAKGWVTR